MSPMIIEMILDLHLREKLMSRPVTALSPEYPERLFPLKVSQILRCNIRAGH